MLRFRNLPTCARDLFKLRVELSCLEPNIEEGTVLQSPMFRDFAALTLTGLVRYE